MSDGPVILYDTTLRDGTQGENIVLSLADKLRIARMLDEYGMPYVEGGWPPSARLGTGPTAPPTTRTCASWSPPRRRS